MNLDKLTNKELANYFRHDADALWDYYCKSVEEAMLADNRFQYSSSHYFIAYWIMDNLYINITKTSRWLELGLNPISDR